MGWQNDDGSHEGWVEGLVREQETDARGYVVSTGRWLEVGADFDHESTDPAMRARREVSHVQVVCTCGWRSQRMIAPLGTYWAPCCTVLPSPVPGRPDWEGGAWRVWRGHLDAGVFLSLSDAARALIAEAVG